MRSVAETVFIPRAPCGGIHPILAASVCMIAMLGLTLAGAAMPIAGKAAIEVVGGCGESSYSVGSGDLVGKPASDATHALRPTQAFAVEIPAGEYRVAIDSEGTRIMERGASSGWRMHVLLGGCAEEATQRTYVARGFGVVHVRTWLLDR